MKLIKIYNIQLSQTYQKYISGCGYITQNSKEQERRTLYEKRYTSSKVSSQIIYQNVLF